MTHHPVYRRLSGPVLTLLILPCIFTSVAWAEPAKKEVGKKIAYSAMNLKELNVLVPTVTLATALQEADKAQIAAQNSYPIAEQSALWDTAVKLVAGAQGLAILRELKFTQAAMQTEMTVLVALKTLPPESLVADENGGPVTVPQTLVADENGGPVTQPTARAGKVAIVPVKWPGLSVFPAIRAMLPRSVNDENGGPVTKPRATPRVADENGGPVTSPRPTSRISDENGGPVTKPHSTSRVADENGGPVTRTALPRNVADENGGPVTMGGPVKSIPSRNF